MRIGSTFLLECRAAGIADPMCIWNRTTGEVSFREDAPQEVRDAVLAVLAVHDPVTSEQNAVIDAQIRALEATATPRRMREAALGVDDGWLAALDAQIAALRTQRLP